MYLGRLTLSPRVDSSALANWMSPFCYCIIEGVSGLGQRKLKKTVRLSSSPTHPQNPPPEDKKRVYIRNWLKIPEAVSDTGF